MDKTTRDRRKLERERTRQREFLAKMLKDKRTRRKREKERTYLPFTGIHNI